jgi:TonB family protein
MSNGSRSGALTMTSESTMLTPSGPGRPTLTVGCAPGGLGELELSVVVFARPPVNPPRTSAVDIQIDDKQLGRDLWTWDESGMELFCPKDLVKLIAGAADSLVIAIASDGEMSIRLLFDLRALGSPLKKLVADCAAEHEIAAAEARETASARSAAQRGDDNSAAWPSPDTFIPVDEMPVLISMPTPMYTDAARQAQLEGVVLVRALVGKDGRVKRTEVAKSIPLLDEAAAAAVAKAVFKAAVQKRQPVAVWVSIPVRFKLK